MKKLLIAFSILASIASPLAVFAQPEAANEGRTDAAGLSADNDTLTAGQTVFTLKEALNYAIENNTSIQKSLLDKKQAEYQINEVRGSGLPQVNGTGQLQHFPNLPTQLLPGEIIGQPGTQVPVQFGTEYTMSGGIQVTQLLYSQSFLTGLRAARSSRELYEMLRIQTEEEVIYQVAGAFYQTLEVQAQIEALQSNLDKLEQVEGLMKIQYENDLVTKTDYNRLRVNKANLVTQLQSLKTVEEQSKNFLKLLTGYPMDVAITLEEGERLESVSLDKLQWEAVTPTSIRLLDKQTELNELNKKNIQAGYFPTLSAFGQQTWQAQRNEFNFFDGSYPWFQQTVLGLTLNVPIFDGLQRRNRVQQSRIDIEKLELDKLQAERANNADYENARNQLINSLSSVEVQEENRALAEEVLGQTQELYKEQVSSLNDLLDAETALREAQINYFREVLKFRKAELDLLKAQGQLTKLPNL